jgi:peptidoglycan/xylan/chitin deacetylase (PgdA/CDA1 family)
MYHGVCRDEEAKDPWMPSFYVTETEFARQMELLSCLGRVVHLPEILATDRVFEVSDDHLAIAVSFDDGPRNVFTLARPILERFGVRCTVFLSTGHVDTGEPLVHNVLQTLRWLRRQDRLPSGTGGLVLQIIEDPGLSKRIAAFQYH